jgi:putative serine protease PepD
VGAIALIASGFALARMTDDDSTSSSPSGTAASVQSVTTAKTLVDQADEPVAAVAAVVAPSVVQIETRAGLGSGVIYDDSGLILTAAHVVGDVRTVTVRTADGVALEGTVVGTSPEFDVGVVKVDPSQADPGSLPPATLALNTPLEVGQLAVAIGSPFGLDQTVTSGVVSAVDRAVTTPNGALGMIQTDAPINPGNSGGALADRHGRVIGINDAIESQSGGNVGVGFAIPIDVAASVAEKLVAGEPVEFAYLGVESGPVAGGRTGAAIKTVVPGTPAADAGLERGDIVLSVDGTPVLTSTDLVALIRSSQPGDKVTLSVERNGDTIEVPVTLGTNQ